MKHCDSIAVHPEVQDGAPVFSGTRVRVETFVDYMRIGVSVNEFLHEFPSITRDQALEVYDLVRQQYTVDQMRQFAAWKRQNKTMGIRYMSHSVYSEWLMFCFQPLKFP